MVPELLYTRMKKENTPFWKINLGGRNRDISSDQECTNVDVQIADLKKHLEEISKTNQFVDVSYSDKNLKDLGNGGKRPNVLTIDLWHNKSINGINDDTMNINEIQAINAEKIELAVLKAQFELTEKYTKEISAKDREIAELKDHIEELEDLLDAKESDNGIGNIMESLKPALAPLIIKLTNNLTGNNNAMAGTNNIHVEDIKETSTDLLTIQKAKCAKACGALLAVDDNAGDNLMMLAEYATLAPDAYKSFIPILKGQLEIAKMK